MAELPLRRRERIARYIQEVGAARTEDLAERFEVSAMTIHRDLDALEAEGWLERTRGGARTGGLRLHERNVVLRMRQQVAQKRALARAALGHLDPGSTLALDDSTTTLALLPHLAALKPMTLITNFLPAIRYATDDPDIDLFGLGGQYDRSLDSFDGPAVIDQLQLLSADAVVMSVASVHKQWLLHPSAETARRKRAFIESGVKRILLVDSTKFAHRASHRLGEIDLFDLVIVDDAVGEEHIEFLRKRGVSVEIASVTTEDITADSQLV
ncbi:DeoR/GlpR family DNA-binding transcription regulator [Mycobacterium sp. Y57]|uniref:DeoR/GlpR family DNA-binding transcription regulator n=1 Tax=Mycolicibacterium xanthum TaxID=2796469 RepID=UPI001C8519A4|nr:DeoR/GlpR family DNA-binding transcription regulator [Mycolicibacterium xanthum]MBX7431134.1 DeoR/GlpR family DNA-binding transcription regulator [Mycolicibacterium xanthum]